MKPAAIQLEAMPSYDLKNGLRKEVLDRVMGETKKYLDDFTRVTESLGMFGKENFRKNMASSGWVHRVNIDVEHRAFFGSACSPLYVCPIWNKSIIRLNVKHLNQEEDECVNDTLPHEIAHVFTDLIYGHIETKSGRYVSHGKEWKAVCKLLTGRVLSRLGKSQILSKHKATYRYKCPKGCCFDFTKIRHGKAKRGYEYICTKHTEDLVFCGETSGVQVKSNA